MLSRTSLLIAIALIATLALVAQAYNSDDVILDTVFNMLHDEEYDLHSDALSGQTLCVTADVLNVRWCADTSCRIVGTRKSGDRVTVQQTHGAWKNIGLGWVHGDYLKPCGGGGGGSGGQLITQAQLQRIIPQLSSSRASQLMPHLNKALKEASINTCRRISAFIAQVAHESGGLQWFEEFASGDAYEGRKDLCNTVPGDGRRFKGRGPIQLTGRCNYTAAGKALGLDLVGNPYQVATFDVGFRTTAWFWNSRSLNQYADQHTQAAFDNITRRINGGYNGKADRDKYWRQAKSVLGC